MRFVILSEAGAHVTAQSKDPEDVCVPMLHQGVRTKMSR